MTNTASIRKLVPSSVVSVLENAGVLASQQDAPSTADTTQVSETEARETGEARFDSERVAGSPSTSSPSTTEANNQISAGVRQGEDDSDAQKYDGTSGLANLDGVTDRIITDKDCPSSPPFPSQERDLAPDTVDAGVAEAEATGQVNSKGRDYDNQALSDNEELANSHQASSSYASTNKDTTDPEVRNTPPCPDNSTDPFYLPITTRRDPTKARLDLDSTFALTLKDERHALKIADLSRKARLAAEEAQAREKALKEELAEALKGRMNAEVRLERERERDVLTQVDASRKVREEREKEAEDFQIQRDALETKLNEALATIEKTRTDAESHQRVLQVELDAERTEMEKVRAEKSTLEDMRRDNETIRIALEAELHSARAQTETARADSARLEQALQQSRSDIVQVQHEMEQAAELMREVSGTDMERARAENDSLQTQLDQARIDAARVQREMEPAMEMVTDVDETDGAEEDVDE